MHATRFVEYHWALHKPQLSLSESLVWCKWSEILWQWTELHGSIEFCDTLQNMLTRNKFVDRKIYMPQ